MTGRQYTKMQTGYLWLVIRNEMEWFLQLEI